MTSSDQSDRFFMGQALRLARRGWGRTSPNPMVGAVIVRDGHVVGRGFHAGAGTEHAEIEALREAGTQARGATLYVTLEPCSSHGRTPPCTAAVIKAGVKRVVIGCGDVNPKHDGKGFELLTKAGIEVRTGVKEEVCRQLNEAFFCWILEKRPFVVLKMAMTLDGRIATVTGDSKWISGERSRLEVQKMRRWCDALMVGGETVRQDNPRLEVVTPRNWSPQPLPIICSRHCDFSPKLKIFQKRERAPEFIAPADKQEWRNFVRNLGERQITALLIEGGGEISAAVLEAGIVDKVMFFIAPKILAGRNSRPVVGGANPRFLTQARNLQRVQVKKVGEDILITGYLNKCLPD